MSCHQNAWQNNNIMVSNKSFENVARSIEVKIAFIDIFRADSIQAVLATFISEYFALLCMLLKNMMIKI
jgi:hypothetical protein